MAGFEGVPLSAARLILWIASAAAAVGATVERQVKEVFPAAEGMRLSVDLAYGSIKVVPASTPEVRLTLTQSVEARNDSAAEREWKNLNLKMTPEGPRALLIRTTDRRTMHWSWQKWPPTTLVLEIAVPHSSAVDLLTREGDVTVGDGVDAVKVRAQTGTVYVGHATGPVTVTVGAGDVTVAGCGADLRVEDRQGSVLIGRCRGRAEAVVAGGNFEIQNAGGPLQVEVAGGEIRAGFARPIGGEANLKGTGDIVVGLPLAAAASVDARTSRPGLIHARELVLVPRAGGIGADSLEADLNGGGPRLNLRSEAGNIRLVGVPEIPTAGK